MKARYAMAVLFLAAAAGGSACLGPLDTLGNETLVTENTDLQKDRQIEDDRIEDKHPVYDPDLIVSEQFDECTIRLNKSGSVTKLDIVPFDEEDGQLDGRLFRGRGQAFSEIGERADLIPSMEVVNGKLKPVNDGLYAAIESDIQAGVEGALPSKRRFLYDLLDALGARLPEASAAQAAELDRARAFVAAALMAGGNPVDLPPDVQAAASQALQIFQADGQLSRPIGFYTWDALLGEVFAQDRFLQNLEDLFGFGAFAAMAAVLADEPELLARYEQIHALYAGLSNPYASYSPLEILPYTDGLASLEDTGALQDAFEARNPPLMTCSRAGYALLPSSRSKDTELYNARWCLSGMPPGVSFIDAFIDAIRSGEVDLAPSPDSGWYDYQLWALETLLLPERGPESDHLLLTAAYKKKLIDTFKSIITQSRETHVKQNQDGMAASVSMPPREVDIYPLLPLEPFPTFYLRTARGYRFLQVHLEAVLGGDYLASAGRLREGGEREAGSLADELRSTIDLLYGLYILTANSVGLDPAAYLLAEETAELDLEAGLAAGRAWLEGWTGDRDVLEDPRVIVPVSVDDGSGQAVYWAVLGVKVLKIRAEFVPGFEPEILGSDECIVRHIVPHDYCLLVEHMEEVRIPGPPLIRDELREICDRHDTVEGILSELAGR
ncbi:MAG: hypothetical protein JXR96_27620 [Deltaproteobacteria bacterium]|nr:hypothetical protein [Deltaproteobacteria bacterium]